jgi:glutathione S-transferase
MVRVYLKEKQLDCELVVDYPWDRKHVFHERHFFSDLPTFVDLNGSIFEGWYAIIEYLEQSYRKNSMFGASSKDKAETRRITALFNEAFYADVTKNVVFEKVIKRHIEHSSPDSSSIRKGNDAIKKYFEHIAWLTDCRNWLAGNEFSLADVAAAAQISCVDYVGSVKWEDFPKVKDWYVRIKSRPSFREILVDRISNVAPPSYYQELDF